MARVVVLGAGLGGIPMALELREQLGVDHRITVIGEGPNFNFVPSNPWVAVGWRKPEEVSVPLAEMFKRRHIEFESAGAQALQPQDNRVVLRDGRAVDYDVLVIATGPELAFDELPGFAEHSHSICTLRHAGTTWERWQRFCEAPGPLVIGAVQGASCFGPAYEYALILDTDLRRRKIRDRVPMTFVTSEPYIGHLGLGGVGDTKGLLESLLRERHIRWIVNARVDRFDEHALHVIEVDEDAKEKRRHELPFAMAMMLPAFRGIGALRDAEGKYITGLTNPRGFVLVDPRQRSPAFPNIFAIGVCIAIPPLEQTPVPTGVPKTGFMIESMVTATAQNIRALLDGKDPTAQPTWNAVCLADFGDKGVAFVAIPQIPPRNVNWSAQGKWVHLAKLAFEKYFIRKVRRGISEPIYERYIMHWLGIERTR